MKLWDLSVRLDVGSNGTEKRAKLYEVAEEIRNTRLFSMKIGRAIYTL